MTILLVAGLGAGALLASCAGANGGRRARQDPAPSSDTARAGMSTVNIEAGGRARNYLLYVPSSYKPGRPMPLVVSFHGGGDSADKMANYTKFPDLAEREGFIVAFPNGTFGKRANGGTWNTGSGRDMGQAEKKGVDDLSFVGAMLSQIKRDYSIDSGRVYVTGMSKGGMMTYTVACHFADQIAAIAPISSTMVEARCQPSSPVAVFHVHGTDDQSVPLNGGRGDNTGGGYDYPPVQKAVDFWTDRNKCSSDRTKQSVGPETVCYTYQKCVRDVTLCLVDGGGHAWPGQEKARWQKALKVNVTQTFHATQEIWQFFEAHPKQ